VEIDIPTDIRTFIDEVIDSFVMWDLLIFCSKKHQDIQSPAQAAQLLGRTEADVEKPMTKLMKMGLAKVSEVPGRGPICQLDPTCKHYTELQKFWAYNENQENRLKILSYLLQRRIR
jgi:hypothetical protein